MTSTSSVDTPAQDMTHYALRDYAADVTETKNTTDALAAISEMTDLRETLADAQTRRDEAIGKMHVEDGLRPPEIARLTGMSLSNVRLICDRAKLLNQRANPND